MVGKMGAKASGRTTARIAKRRGLGQIMMRMATREATAPRDDGHPIAVRFLHGGAQERRRSFATPNRLDPPCRQKLARPGVGLRRAPPSASDPGAIEV